TLDEPYRTALLLRFFDDLPPREVARRTGVPVETARARIRRGIEQLRGRLDAAHGGDGRAWKLALVPLIAPEAAAAAARAPPCPTLFRSGSAATGPAPRPRAAPPPPRRGAGPPAAPACRSRRRGRASGAGSSSCAGASTPRTAATGGRGSSRSSR